MKFYISGDSDTHMSKITFSTVRYIMVINDTVIAFTDY